MTKQELVNQIAEDANITKKAAEAALKSFTGSVAKSLKGGNSVTLIGFGTFGVSARAARTGRNPRTNQPIQIPARKVPVFKAGKALKETVN